MNGAMPDSEQNALTEAEAGIVGILVWLPNHAHPRLAKVDFELRDPRHRLILEAIRKRHCEGKVADLPWMLDWLGETRQLEAAGGREYLVQLVDSACNNGAYLFDGYVETLKRLAGARGQAPVGDSPSQPLGAAVSDESNCPGLGSDPAVSAPEATPNVVTPVIRMDRQGTGGARLLEELRDVFLRYVILPPRAAEVLALWTMHTYAWRLRSVTAYLGIVSPVKRCGKTTLLTLLNKVAHQTEFASNVSPPSIYRVIEERRPTLLIDEGDTFLAAKDELRGILNAGYTRDSAYVLRATGEGQLLRRYSCWCPKVIATIGSLPETLADRCVILTMRRKKPGERCARLRNFDGSELRERCARWVEENGHAIETLEPAVPEALNDRAADIWEPLLVLADLAGGTWPEVARAAALSFSVTSAEQDFSIRLLKDLEAIFDVSKTDKLFSRQLVEALTMMAERPWRELRRGGAINELWLAQQLGAFGIESRTLRIGDLVGRGYYLKDFSDAFGRYLPRAA